MGWSFRVARLAGIDVRIHVTFLLLLAYFAYAGYVIGGPAAAVSSVLFVLLLFVCVVLHKFGHALAAARYGIKTPDITLLPFGGVARLQRMPEHPGQELVVAIAGPLVNVVIAVALFAGLGLRGYLNLADVARVDNPGLSLLYRLLVVNVWLVLFNLIPAFPMDGGRVLRALLAMRLPYARATRIAASVGQVLAFGFGLWGLMTANPMLFLIALFVYFGAGQEAAVAQMRDVARHVPVADAMLTQFRVLHADETLGEAVETLLRTNQHDFPVTDSAGKVVGLLTREDMIRALQSAGPNVPVSSVMHRDDVPSVSIGTSVEEAFKIMAESEVPAVLVHDGRGRLVGMVTAENVGQMVTLGSAFGNHAAARVHSRGPLPAAVLGGAREHPARRGS